MSRSAPVAVGVALLLAALLTGCPPRQPLPEPYNVVVPTPAPAMQGLRYTIRPGDTLFSIAQRHGVDWRTILDANRIVNPRDLPPGQVIVIPGGAETEPAADPMAQFNSGHAEPIPAESAWAWPLRGEVFGRFQKPMPWRMREQNQGIDIRAARGQSIVAAKSGRVNTFETVPGYGRTVVLEHSDNTQSLYGHLDRILVKHGTWVKQGEVIGAAGSTGQSDGVELHFRIMQGGKFVDPMPKMP